MDERADEIKRLEKALAIAERKAKHARQMAERLTRPEWTFALLVQRHRRHLVRPVVSVVRPAVEIPASIWRTAAQEHAAISSELVRAEEAQNAAHFATPVMRP